MKQCIFCLELKPDDEFNVEHIFPQAIGGNLTTKLVCISCNSRLGEMVDNHLVDNWLIQGKRHNLRIKGQSGKVPPLFPTKFMHEESGQTVEWRFGKDGTSSELYIVPSFKSVEKDGVKGTEIYLDNKDINKLRDFLKKRGKRLTGRSPEPEKVEKFIAEHVQNLAITHPELLTVVPINTQQYKRAILKIGYELAVEWLGLDYVNDPVAEALRNAIWDEAMDEEWFERNRLKGDIDFVNKNSHFSIWNREADSHIAFMHVFEGNIACSIRIFDVFEGVIFVSYDADSYELFDKSAGRFVAINPVTKARRESSLDVELARLTIEYRRPGS